jgi:hypothetical protein
LPPLSGPGAAAEFPTSMSLAVLRSSTLVRPAYWRQLWRRMGRGALLAVAWLLVAFGLIGAVLPGHLGVPVLIVGLIVVLRSSFQARRQFIDLQRRHPRIVLPIRRLLRRDPEVLAVAWQQVLRLERLILPTSWRIARRLRKRFSRSARMGEGPRSMGD